jgi:hypothetical protein
MGSAIGGGSNTRTPNGSLSFDVRDYGAFPDITPTCGDEIQAAIDAASVRAATTVGPVEVFLPYTATAHRLQRPLRINQSYVKLIGPPGRARLSCAGDFPAIILGVPQTGTGAMDATFRPDPFGLGVLDSTAVTAAGQRHGFRSKRNAFLAFHETSFDLGKVAAYGHPDRYATQQTLTFEMCLTPGDTTIHTLTPVGFLCGAGALYQETPFTLAAVPDDNGNTALQVAFRTADQDRGGQTHWSFQCHLSGSAAGKVDIPGPWDIAFQMDLSTATFGFWVNGIRRALTASTLPSAGKHFLLNILSPFTFFAGGGPQLPQNGSAGSYPDLCLWGARLSSALVYNWSTVGSAQTRVGPGLVNSSTRYFATSNADSTTLALLPMTDVASGEAAISGYHHVLVNGPLGNGYPTQMGLFLTYAYFGGILDNVIENIEINSATDSGGKISGFGIAIGGCLHTRIKNCRIKAGGYPIGSLNSGATYVVYVDDCSLSGNDSNIYFFNTHAVINNCQFVNMGVFTTKFCGCRATIRGSFSEDSDGSPYAMVAMFAGNYDAQYIIDDWLSDTESGGFQWAAFYCQGSAYSGTQFDLANVTVFTVGVGATVWLDDGGAMGSVYPRSNFTARGVNANGSSMLKLSGSGWQGRWVSNGGTQGPRIFHTQEFGTDANVRIVDDGQEPRFFNPNNLPAVGPPMDGSWYLGAHQVIAARPLPGQYSEWRVTATGTVGSATPPAFAGINPVACPFGTLAGYSGSHDLATATLTA